MTYLRVLLNISICDCIRSTELRSRVDMEKVKVMLLREIEVVGAFIPNGKSRVPKCVLICRPSAKVMVKKRDGTM